MYNEENKTKFIRQRTKNLNVARLCERIFDATEKYEAKAGADICTMNVDQLKPILSDIIGLRQHDKYQKLLILRDYTRWCMNTGFPGAVDDMLNADTDGIEKCRRQMVADPDHMQRVLDSMFAKEKYETMDVIFRVYCWLIYGGVLEEDVPKIVESDVDLDKMRVYYKNKIVPIYPQALEAFRRCLVMKEICYYATDDPDRKSIRERMSGQILVRGVRTVSGVQTMRVLFSKSNNNNGRGVKLKEPVRLSTQRIYLSGLFFRTLEGERRSITANFLEEAELFMCGREYKLPDRKNAYNVKKKQIANQYLEDYQMWKAAFHN